MSFSGRPKHKRRLDPYYKVVSDHSNTCSIAEDIRIHTRTKCVYFDGYSDSDNYFENGFRLNLRPPNKILIRNDERLM